MGKFESVERVLFTFSPVKEMVYSPIELAWLTALIIFLLSPDVDIEINISFISPNASTCLEKISSKFLSLPIAVIVETFLESEKKGIDFLLLF